MEDKAPLAARNNGIELAKWQNFFFHCNKKFLFTFLSSKKLNSLLLFFFAYKLFFVIFVKCFWRFGYAKSHSLCDYNLAIIKPRAYLSTYLLIKWLIFSCWVNFLVAHCDCASTMGWDASYHAAYLRKRTTCKGRLNVAKVRYKLRVTSGLNLAWYGSME